MKKTGIYVTESERIECQALAKTASNTPVIAFGGGPSWAERAWKECHQKVYQLALEHGLPEIKGYYGLTQDGEFVEADA